MLLVNPVWDGGYDPTFCEKMKNGWVYCGCNDNEEPGMKEGVDTCIDKGIDSQNRVVKMSFHWQSGRWQCD